MPDALPARTLADRIAAALAFTSPGWRPEAREDTWESVREMRRDAAMYARLSVDFLMGTASEPDANLARYYAAKAHLTAEAAGHMGERLGGAL
jgi:hypothetical protein